MDRNNGSIIGPTNTTTPTAAGGYWSLVEQYQAQRNGDWIAPGYNISRSLRFNSADSATLTRTPASASNQKTWTWSGWIKRGKLGIDSYLFSSGTNASNVTLIRFVSSDILRIYTYNSAVSQSQYLDTVVVFRDPSAWYHVVGVHDTTQAVTADRLKLYVNGVQQTGTTTGAVNQNTDGVVNSTNEHFLGPTSPYSTQLFDGYMTEVNFIDGQALTPASFGVTDTVTGVWRPIQYTGTYGTNGFYLNFSDNSGTTSTTLGKDYSGNSNNWTPNNFSVTAGAGNDSLVDTPTPYGTDTGAGGEVRGNYCTINPLGVSASTPTISDGNLQMVLGIAQLTRLGTISVISGKWYWEVVYSAATAFDGMVGVATSNTDLNTYVGANSTSWGYYYTGQKYRNSSPAAYGNSWTLNDVIGVALDMDNGAIYFSKNGVFQNSGVPTSGASMTGAAFTNLSGLTIAPAYNGYGGTQVVNHGQRPFAYTAPAGFKALCTQNLPTPTIGATATTRADDYFNTVLYTGNGSTQTVSGVGFQPDLVWNKQRSSSVGSNWLNDAVRTAGYSLSSNRTDAEADFRSYFTAFNSDGFSLAGGTDGFNASAATYVGWCWKANGAGSTNTQGTITSTVSVNTTAGFSIVTYTGTGSGTPTVGHGLGVAPSMIFVKSRSNSVNWGVGHVSAGWANAALLNATNAFGASTYFASTAPTSTVFSIQDTSVTNISSATYVAYCFAAVAGYSAFGSYVGNGVGFVGYDGPFVYTGFRPRYVLIKVASGSTDMGAGKWCIYDAARNPYNVTNLLLYANLSAAEGNGSPYLDVDLLSNGFKIRGGNFGEINGNGNTYIYAAFAEFPFKYTLAR